MVPYNFSYYAASLPFGYLFNVWIKKRHTGWWQKYALGLTTAFQIALALSAIVIFFAVEYKPKSLNWWGNEVSYAGVDGSDECILKYVPEGGHF